MFFFFIERTVVLLFSIVVSLPAPALPLFGDGWLVMSDFLKRPISFCFCPLPGGVGMGFDLIIETVVPMRL